MNLSPRPAVACLVDFDGGRIRDGGRVRDSGFNFDGAFGRGG
jgi:hypothetical protein